MRGTVLMFLGLLCSLSALAQDYVPVIPDSVPPMMEVIATERRDGYECRLIEYDTDFSERIRAYLLVPDSARRRRCPAILMLHDHGARFDIGKEKLVRPISGTIAPEYTVRSSRQWVEKNFDGVYLADFFAYCGYVILVSDALYWGERSSVDARRWSELSYGEQAEATLASDRYMSKAAVKDTLKALKSRVYEGQRAVYEEYSLKGDIWAEKILRDDIAATDLLACLPYVDRKNIGAFGFSMGAHRCWLLAAYCEKIKCAAAVSWMTLKSIADTTSASSLSMVIPPLRSRHDYPDIASLIAPKPMLFLSGTEDHLFPQDAVTEAFEKMQRIYCDVMAKEGYVTENRPCPLLTEFFTGGHHCGIHVRDRVLRFFDGNLGRRGKLRKSPGQKIRIVSPN